MTGAKNITRVLSVLAALLVSCTIAFALAMPAQVAWAEPQPEKTDQSDESLGDATAGTGSVEDAETKNKVNEGQLPDSSFLYDTDISELASADAYYDNQTVQIRGEVVGDHIRDEAGAGYWITLQDTESDTSAKAVVAVFMTEEQTQAIDTYGRYGVQGTILQVRGMFHLECKAHQGLSDVHAEEVTPVTKGSALEIKPNSAILTAAFLSLLFGFGLLIVYYRLRERLR